MDHQDPAMERKHYGKLALMVVLSFISMYILMYAMVDKATSIHPSLNQAYMAGLMTAPMVVIELMLMSMMYTRRGVNAVLLVVSVVSAVRSTETDFGFRSTEGFGLIAVT